MLGMFPVVRPAAVRRSDSHWPLQEGRYWAHPGRLPVHRTTGRRVLKSCTLI